MFRTRKIQLNIYSSQPEWDQTSYSFSLLINQNSRTIPYMWLLNKQIQDNVACHKMLCCQRRHMKQESAFQPFPDTDETNTIAIVKKS